MATTVLWLLPEYADVVRDAVVTDFDAVVTDFAGAVDFLTRLKADVEARLGVSIPAAHGAFPPGVSRSEVRPPFSTHLCDP